MSTIDTPTETRTDIYPSRVGGEARLLERQDPVVWGDVGGGPLDADALSHYEQSGTLGIERVLTEEHLDQCREELDGLRDRYQGSAEPGIVTEPRSREVRSVFGVHRGDGALAALTRHPGLVSIARQLLGSDVYIHQSRINYKPGFRGKEFYWHSDFETWHVEDGMPRMRAVSVSISLTANHDQNGPLMLVPGSHRLFLSCPGETPENHHEQSLAKQEYGVPDDASLAAMVDRCGITAAIGPAGGATLFECNVMHGSNGNITPWPRSNVFVVYNSVENPLAEPFSGQAPRPGFLAEREDLGPLPA